MQGSRRRVQNVVRTVYQAIDVAAVILLLTGQITIRGVFVTPEGVSLSLSGPITGRPRVTAIPEVPRASVVLDALDIIAALLLLMGQINVIGTFVTSGGFTIVVGGPPFGLKKKEAYVPEAVRFFTEYRNLVLQKCQLHPAKKKD